MLHKSEDNKFFKRPAIHDKTQLSPRLAWELTIRLRRNRCYKTSLIQRLPIT